MLANNNKAMLKRLARNTVKTNRRQFAILFFTVALAACMLFCVFTIGITYLHLSRLQDTRLFGAEYDAVVANGFTEEQKAILMDRSDVRSVGVLSYAGYAKSTDADDTIDVGLLWCDSVYWETMSAPARTGVKGTYPEKENELMVTREALRACGKETLEPGDCFVMNYEDNTGVHRENFVISGIWEGYGNQAIFYVSEAFFQKSGYALDQSGILYIKYDSDFVTNRTIEETQESLSLSNTQVFQASDYITHSITVLMGICGLGFILCLSAYLLIYNILYLSVSGKIRYYGLLQALGMTKHQLTDFIRRQTLPVGMAGIVIGGILGIFLSLALVPYMMRILGIASANLEIHFYPGVLLLSIGVTGVSMLWGIHTPVRMAAKVTPVEAARYRSGAPVPVGIRKRKRGHFFWRMAMDQLRRDKTKVIVVFLSLATSLSVFYCLTTIISSYGDRTVMPNYWDADLIVENDTQTAEDMDSLLPALDGEMLAKLENMEGIERIHAVTGVPITLPYKQDGFTGMWLEGYLSNKPYLSYEEAEADYRKHPEHYYGMLKGIDDAEFDYLNGTLGTPVDRQDFLEGRICILVYGGFEIPAEYTQGTVVNFDYQNQNHGITVGAVDYDGYYFSSTVGPSLIVSRKYLEELSADPVVLSLNIKYEQAGDEATERTIMESLSASPYDNDLTVTSRLEDLRTIREAQGSMQEIGTAIALLLLLVGALNYVNTMASGIQNRKLTFSIMESVGMSPRQIRRLLIREGCLYAFFSILITLTVGTAVTYICFRSMNYMGVPFSVPILPLLSGMLLVFVLCIAAPLLSYRRLSDGRPVAERLRMYE